MILFIFAQLLQIAYSKNLKLPNQITNQIVTNDSGYCGINLTWTFESDTLTISGEGEMNDFISYDSVPWHSNISEIQNVVINEGCTSIGNYAFHGLRNLIKIDLPETLISIGKYSFQNCTKLTSLTIPTNVNSISEDSFVLMNSLISFNVNSENKFYKSINGILFNSLSTELIKYPIGIQNKSYQIQYGVSNIKKNAFKYSNLESIEIPPSVISIEQYAFAECSQLTQIILPFSITSISDYAFFNCAKMTNVTFGNKLSSIGKSTFSMCNLISIELPSTLANIGQNAFFSNIGLTSVKFNGLNDPTHGSLVFDSCVNLTVVDVNHNYQDSTFCGISVHLEPSDSDDNKGKKIGLICGVTIFSVLIVVLIVLIGLTLHRRNNQQILLSELLASQNYTEDTKHINT